MTATAPLLAARGITKRYAGVVALADVDIELRAGEVVGLLGANGSGKSTLCSILAGDNRAEAGSFLVDGKPVQPGSPAAARRAGVAIAHQHPGIAPDLPVWENVFLGAELCGAGRFLDRATARRRAGELLSGLRAGWRLEAPAGTLTAADQQLVEIARALALEPRLLILDEPTAALAPAEVASLVRVVRALAERGVAIVFISHRMAEIETLCQRVIVLCNGRLAGELEVGDRMDERQVLAWMSGGPGAASTATVRRHGSPALPASSTRDAANDARIPRLRVRGLKAGTALRGVDFDARAGEILGVAGLQGHGQEALLDALAGYRPPESGEVELDGVRLAPRTPRDMIRAGVCLVPNDRHRQGLWLDHPVEFNLAQASVNFERKGWRLRRGEMRAFVDEVVQRLRIKTSNVQEPVRGLSGGNQQKVVIGRWLDPHVNVKVLLLSDPTKGVDILARKEIYEAIGSLVEAGAAAVVYASDTEELIAVCDRVIVMYEGAVVEQLEGHEITEARMTRAMFGRSAA